MNRGISHQVMAIHKNEEEFLHTVQIISHSSEEKSSSEMDSLLPKLVKFYEQLMLWQQLPHKSPFNTQFLFFGMRDLYHLIEYITFSKKTIVSKSSESYLITAAISQNFGGLMKNQFDTFLFPIMSEIFGFNYGMANLMWNTYSSINLIKENILQSQNQTKMNSDYDQRHIMLITDSETTWKFLYDMNILQHVTSRVIFGSQFRNEQNSSLLFHQNIEKIKNAMSNGHTVVLLHLNKLYDSLYHVLNQRYIKIGSKQFSSISISDETIRVQIHPSFRFIIVS
eukprot:456053_1